VTYTSGGPATTLTANYGGDSVHNSSSGKFEVFGNSTYVVCVSFFIKDCEGKFPPPNPVQVCLSNVQTCTGFGGSGGSGTIDMSGLPSSLSTSVACQESRRKLAAETRAPTSTDPTRPANPCVVSVGVETSDSQERLRRDWELLRRAGESRTFEQFVWDVNYGFFIDELQHFEQLMTQALRDMCQGIGCSVRQRNVALELEDRLLPLLEARFRYWRKEGTPVRKGGAGLVNYLDICNQLVPFGDQNPITGNEPSSNADSRDWCKSFGQSFDTLLRIINDKVSDSKSETKVDKPRPTGDTSARAKKSFTRAATAAARRRTRTRLLGGTIQVHQGRRTKLRLKVDKTSRARLRALRRAGVKRIRATMVTRATILPGVFSTRRVNVVILLTRTTAPCGGGGGGVAGGGGGRPCR
jgi:hypothetical protein